MEFLERKDIWISPYRLQSRGFLNSLSARREFAGALIRAGDGYGCIHPWPELGDPPLDKCLEDLRGRRFWPIVRRAMRCAEFDNAARTAEESLFEEMEIPVSHATLVKADAAEVAAAVEAGFTVVKMKAGRNLEREAEFLKAMAEAHPGLKWRLDFNESLNPEGAENFLETLGEAVRRKIDFLEDISAFSEATWAALWKKYRVPLAVDMESGPHRKAAQVTVIKPAVDEPFLLGEAAAMNSQRVVMTSYMDHPLGQAFAAWEAARLELLFPGLVGICGLQTHHLFKKDAFVEKLGDWKPGFTVPGGTGLGFDDELAALPWLKL
ncbi:MAG: enolase C-terminal domain-like protein [Luteolibacter sp.]